MKRADLSVGMTVETRMGIPMRVVSVDRWRSPDYSISHLVGIEVDGVPVETLGRRRDGAQGVLLVGENRLKTVDSSTVSVSGRVMQPGQLHPLGTYAAQRAAEDAAFEAAWEAEIANDQGLIAQMVQYWGGKAAHLLQVCGVEPDEDGRLTKDERKTVVTMILCGQNR